jgi:hypothetical protein
MKKNIKCFCGTNFQFDYEEEIDLDKQGDYLESILKGTFMSTDCPSCKKKHKPEFKIFINWKSKKYRMEVVPELERGEFYRNKKENTPYETIIGFPEMADRLAVIKDDLEPVVIETLKYFILVKAAENYPDKDINAWYYCKTSEGDKTSGIEFHLDGIRTGEVAVMRIPYETYEKTLDDFRKKPKSDTFSSLRLRSYLSVQNILRPDALK